jgi:hypothetical protein
MPRSINLQRDMVGRYRQSSLSALLGATRPASADHRAAALVVEHIVAAREPGVKDEASKAHPYGNPLTTASYLAASTGSSLLLSWTTTIPLGDW